MSDKSCIFTPLDFLKYFATRRNVSLDAIRVPENLVITYQRSIYECAKTLVNGKPVDWWIYDDIRPLCVGEYDETEVAIDNIWVGASAAVMTLEELIACGARRVFEVGMCGGLQTYLKPGDIVLPTTAIRDEGTSNHYLPPEDIIHSSKLLTANLVNILNQKGIEHYVGCVWSTDGVYRETREKFRKFKDVGVLGVNMETSAIFAVAKFRGVEAASAQIILDILTESEWQPHFLGHQSVRKNIKILVEQVLKALSHS